jgi:hypothetical protein
LAVGRQAVQAQGGAQRKAVDGGGEGVAHWVLLLLVQLFFLLNRLEKLCMVTFL